MNNTGKGPKIDPWQLITILIIVLVVLSGQFMLNQTMNTRLDIIDKKLDSETEMIRRHMERLSMNATANAKVLSQVHDGSGCMSEAASSSTEAVPDTASEIDTESTPDSDKN